MWDRVQGSAMERNRLMGWRTAGCTVRRRPKGGSVRRYLLSGLLLGLCICLIGLPADQVAAAATPTRSTAKVPMRDGTLLATDVYLPAGDPPWPVALVRTPYGKANVGDHTGIQPSRFAKNGI